MTYRYFAYGSALDRTHVAEWAREHGYHGFSLVDGQPAAVDDHELALTVPSRYWMGAVGTLIPRPGATTYGVLFELPEADAEKVRHKEGATTGLYREIAIEVRLWAPGAEDDVTMQLLEAHAFVAAEGRAVPDPPPPSERWLEAVIAGAEAHGLPAPWIAELKRKGRR